MVFKSFTWQQFLVAALVLAGIWYGVVLPLLYRRQLKDWLGSRKGKPDLRAVSRDWDAEIFEEPVAEADEELIGRSRLPEGVSRVSMDMFGFADPPEADRSRAVQQGLLPDVIEELKGIFDILERDKGTKEDFFSLFASVRAKYASVRDTPNVAALNELIRERALFPISDDELNHLWD